MKPMLSTQFLLTTVAVGGLTLAASHASAQSNTSRQLELETNIATSGVASPSSAPARAVASEPQRREVAQPVCFVEGSAVLTAEDAKTIGEIFCTAFDEIQVKGKLDSAAVAYRVRILKLGSQYLMKVTQESKDGRAVRSSQLRVDALEDAFEAAPRLAQSIAQEVPVETTATVENLTLDETRQAKLKGTPLQFAVGIGTAMSAESHNPASGLEGWLGYNGADYSAGARVRILGPGGGQEKQASCANTQGYCYHQKEYEPYTAELASLAIEYKRFLGTGNTSPFVGAALGIEAADTGSHHGKGMFGQAMAGVETMRFTHMRVGAALQLDLPAYLSESSDSQRKYVPFLGLGAYVAFGRGR